MTNMPYTFLGNSGIQISALSLGTWHNFDAPGKGSNTYTDHKEWFDNCKNMIHTAFDAGINHFDSADGYGSEETLGKIVKDMPRKDMIICTKSGYAMGPAGRWCNGSRKHIIQQCDESLQKLGMNYVDIYTHHCPDPNTPMEETMAALDSIVRSGKALYTGLSSYNAAQTAEAYHICDINGFAKPIYHQSGYSLIDRTAEGGLFEIAKQYGMGYVAITTLAQGRLTDKYLNGIPKNSRMAVNPNLQNIGIEPEMIDALRTLDVIAKDRGQSIAQLALAWALHSGHLDSVLVGASRPEQILENIQALDNTNLSDDEIASINAVFPARLEQLFPVTPRQKKELDEKNKI